MEKSEILKLIEIRKLLIEEYKYIPGKDAPSSLIRAKDVALTLDQAIRKIDGLLKENNVNFGE